MKNNKFIKGFTLIELLVVIAIIGILAAIVYAPFQTALKKGRDAKRISEMATLQSDLLLYSDSHNGAYPASMNELLLNVGSTSMPANVNYSTTYNPNKYNYTSYTDAGVVRGYHLYTHLESASNALNSSAKCYSVSSTNPCYNNSSASISTGSVDESTINNSNPTSGSSNTADFFQATAPSDSICSTNISECIYDIKG